MSLAGFKKQLNKANQYVSEKIGGAKGTELDDEFVEMERKIDVMGNLVNELMARTHEHLQPNPASRAKLSAVKSISKLRGQANVLLYPQPEGQLGECMVKFGKDLGDDSLFGAALCEAGEAYKQLADIKYGLEDNVKQNFIEPLHHIQTKDLKEVNHHRKKLSGRRLDFDCKRRKQVKGATGAPAGGPQVSGSNTVTEEDIISAEEKFQESKLLAETAMFNTLENDVEQISALASFIEAEVNFHRQSADILQGLHEVLQERIQEAANRPRREHVPKRITSFSSYDRTPSPSHGANHDKTGNNFDIADHGGYSLSPAPPSYNQSTGGSRDVYEEPWGGSTLAGTSTFSKPQTSSAKVQNNSQQSASNILVYIFDPVAALPVDLFDPLGGFNSSGGTSSFTNSEMKKAPQSTRPPSLPEYDTIFPQSNVNTATKQNSQATAWNVNTSNKNNSMSLHCDVIYLILRSQFFTSVWSIRKFEYNHCTSFTYSLDN